MKKQTTFNALTANNKQNLIKSSSGIKNSMKLMPWLVFAVLVQRLKFTSVTGEHNSRYSQAVPALT